ncbi:MAG: PAS domain S-box protein [Gemmataceae bacterium]
MPNRRPLTTSSMAQDAIRKFIAFNRHRHIAFVYFLIGQIWIWLSFAILAYRGLDDRIGFWTAAVNGSIAIAVSALLVLGYARSRFVTMTKDHVLLQAVIEGAKDAVFVKDAGGKYVMVNEVAARMINLPVSLILGKRDSELFDAESARRIQQSDRRVLTTCEPLTLEEEFPVNGVTKTLLTTKTPYYDADRRVCGVVGISRDISDQHHANVQLLTERDRYEKLAEAVPLVLCSYQQRADGSVCIPFASKRIESIFGISTAKLAEDASGIFDRIQPEDADSIRSSVELSARTMSTWRAEFRVQSPVLGEIWVEGSSVPSRQPDGSVLWHGYIHNITEQKRTTIALGESEGQFRATFEQAAVGITHVDLDGRFMKVNGRFAEMTGFTFDDLSTLTFQQITYPDDLSTDEALMQQLLKGERENYSLEKRYIRKNGSIVWVNLTVSLRRTTDGQPLHYISVIEDITARKQAETALRDSEERFRAVVDQATDAFFLLDKTGRIVDTNRAACEMLDYPRNDLIGRRADAIESTLSEAKIQEITQSLRSGATIAYDANFLRKGGHPVPVEVRTRLLEIGGEKYGLSIARDNTERVRTEAAIREHGAFVRGVLDSVSAHIAVLDPNGNIIAVNAAWRDFGRNESFMVDQAIGTSIGKNYLEVCEQSARRGCHDGVLAIAAIRQVLSGELPRAGFEYFYQSTSGYRWFEMAVTPLELAQGGAVVSHLDITDRKQAELLATENRAKLQAALNSMSDAVCISDKNGQFVELNDAFARVHKFSSKSECSRWFSDYPDILELYFLNGEPVPLEMWAVSRALRGEIGTEVEYRLRRKDTGVEWIGSYNFGPIKNQNGEIVGSVAVGRDVTAQKQAEEARSRLASIVESSSDAIMSKSLDGMILTWNDGAKRLFGYDADEMIGGSVSRLIPPERRGEEEQILTCIRNGILVANYDTERVTKHGNRITVSMTTSPIRDNSGQVIGASKIVHDISERKRAEASIRDSESRFRTLVECLPIAVCIVANGEITFCNPAATELFGAQNRDQILNRSPIDLIHPEDREAFRQRLLDLELYRSPLPIQESRGIRLDDGRSVPVHVLATPVQDHGKEATLLVLRDLSDQKRAEEFVASQNAILEQIASGGNLNKTLTDIVRIVENENIGVIASILLLDREGRLRVGASRNLPAEYNAAIEGVAIGPNVGSCGTAAFMGKTIDVQDIATDPLWANYRELALSHGLTACWSIPIFAAQRGSNPPEVLGTFAIYNLPKVDRDLYYDVLVDRAGHLASIAIETARTASDLRNSEERFRTLVDSLPDAVFLNIGGKVAFCNLSCLRLFGASEQSELLGKSPFELHPPEYHDIIRNCIASQEFRGAPVAEIEEEIIRLDGRRVPVTVIALPIVHGGTHAHLVVLRDLTVLRQLEDQFREAQKMEAIGRLAGGVAHDFNNLLTVINGYADIMLAGLPMGHVSRPTITAIRSAGERAAGLTSQLLAFSRKAVITPRVLDLNSVTRESDKLLRRLIGEDVRLSTTLDPESCYIQADPNQIDQILLNLAVNARDTMPDGGRLTIGTRRISIENSDSPEPQSIRPGQYVELSVADTGCGMTDAVKAKLFEPFFTTKGVGKGTGLGLAVVHGVVKQAGGHISVESTVGQGTTFRLLFPEVDPPLKDATKVDQAKDGHGHETILMVEDEDSVRALCRLSLESQGYQVLEAESGVAALDIVKNHPDPIHLLVTDLIMPEMSGRELALRIREARPGIRVLYVSGYTDDSEVVQGVREATDAFLQKPFTPLGLARKVRAVLDDRDC